MTDLALEYPHKSEKHIMMFYINSIKLSVTDSVVSILTIDAKEVLR